MKHPELLIPASSLEVLKTAVVFGADAVYIGGEAFGLRAKAKNFSMEEIREGIAFAHAHDVKVYITANILAHNGDLSGVRAYFEELKEIKPDALIISDPGVFMIAREVCPEIDIHISTQANNTNYGTYQFWHQLGARRVVTARELSMAELKEIREKAPADLEMETFIHGAMCISYSGRCLLSNYFTGRDANRGACTHPCRWKYAIVEETRPGEYMPVYENERGTYIFNSKDLCMIEHIPELIDSGIDSFKIEGRMRSADFVANIVSIYRRAIDSYVADPAGYHVNEEDWKNLFENRVRDYSTCFAMDKPDSRAIGYTGKREPRFFSYAAKEADLDCEWLNDLEAIKTADNKPKLAVKAATLAHAREALANGANILYVAGEVYRPHTPWTLGDIKTILQEAHNVGAKVIVNTPRTTLKDQCSELEQLCHDLNEIKPDGIMVGNLGAATIVCELTDLPIYADHSFNVFNHVATEFLQENGIVNATASYELPYAQVKTLVESSKLPMTITVHGNVEAMISDTNIPALNLKYDPLTNPEFNDKHFALLDTVGGKHSMRVDQFGRIHILFTNDLCLLPYIDKLMGADTLRIEAQDYTPEVTGMLTKIYRDAIDNGKNNDMIEKIKEVSPRPVGIGVYRHKKSY